MSLVPCLALLLIIRPSCLLLGLRDWLILIGGGCSQCDRRAPCGSNSEQKAVHRGSQPRGVRGGGGGGGGSSDRCADGCEGV